MNTIHRTLTKQENLRAYGTAVSKVVNHLNLIQLNCSEIMEINLYILVFHWLISNICAVQFTL